MLIPDTIEKINRLIVLKNQQIKLLEELKANLQLAERAGVDPKQIDRGGYDADKDERWKKWPGWMKDIIRPRTNYVILKDGRRIDVPIDWKGELEAIRDAAKAAKK